MAYRLVFNDLSSETQRRQLIDALAVLLVRLHLGGFFWGDCSLNNILFRRDAGAIRAYVVDTETSEFHDQLSPGQRRHDLEIGLDNVAGGLYELQAEGSLSENVDPVDVIEALATATTRCGQISQRPRMFRSPSSGEFRLGSSG